eukprot:c11932_g1_i1 orf=11-217(-)
MCMLSSLTMIYECIRIHAQTFASCELPPELKICLLSPLTSMRLLYKKTAPRVPSSCGFLRETTSCGIL